LPEEAVLKTTSALIQEKRFADSLDREVTTRLELNTETINDSISTIEDLIMRAEAIEDTPTLLPEEGLADYRLALEDIILAPQPHAQRELRTAQQHIQDALDHLIDPQQQQSQGQGEGDPQEGQGGGGSEPQEGEGGEQEGEGEGGRQGEQEGQGEDGDNPQGDRPDGNEGSGGQEEGDEGEGGETEDDAESDLKRAEKESGDLRERIMERMGDKFRREGKRIPRRKNH